MIKSLIFISGLACSLSASEDSQHRRFYSEVPVSQQPKTAQDNFLSAARSGDILTLEAYLSNSKILGIDFLSTKDALARTALHLAIIHSQFNAVKLLLRNGADYMLATDKTGKTPLILALERSYGDPIRGLILRKLDKDGRTYKGSY